MTCNHEFRTTCEACVWRFRLWRPWPVWTTVTSRVILTERGEYFTDKERQ